MEQFNYKRRKFQALKTTFLPSCQNKLNISSNHYISTFSWLILSIAPLYGSEWVRRADPRIQANNIHRGRIALTNNTAFGIVSAVSCWDQHFSTCKADSTRLLISAQWKYSLVSICEWLLKELGTWKAADARCGSLDCKVKNWWIGPRTLLHCAEAAEECWLRLRLRQR